ncbi:MAG: hypothetical protein D6705_07970 [Deltaproteobacteria bacterium]|nr:MAG: hypothetical protein D6705_07970 [Deltaproteobacteria bacterium]
MFVSVETATAIALGALAGAAAVAVPRMRAHLGLRHALHADARALEAGTFVTPGVLPALRPLVDQERIARLLLAAQARRLETLGLGATWSRGALEAYDHAIASARHALWEFVHGVYALPRDVKMRLWQAGYDPRPLERLVLEKAVFERTDDPYAGALLPRRPRLSVVHRALRRAAAELDRFEAAALRLSASPYR